MHGDQHIAGSALGSEKVLMTEMRHCYPGTQSIWAAYFFGVQMPLYLCWL